MNFILHKCKENFPLDVINQGAKSFFSKPLKLPSKHVHTCTEPFNETDTSLNPLL